MILTDIMNLFYFFFLIIYSVSCCFMDGFSDEKFETLLTFYDFYFYLVIHLIPKWRPINYSFVCKLISPLRLIFTSKFSCVLHMLTRPRGLINMQTK